MTPEELPEPYCDGLDTAPCPGNGPVLVTGATGYVGGRLVRELLERGYSVRAMVRAPSPEHKTRWLNAEVVVADAADEPALEAGLKGVTTAYYLIHSLLLGPKAFHEQDLVYARNFRKAAASQGVKRIIYLGGLGDVRTKLSLHLYSRVEVANELCGGDVPVTTLRAAIIIGSGSASYEIVRHLVKNMPFLAIPSWGRTKCQPIAIRDVIRYLVGSLETPGTAGKSLDIGGPDILTYEDMMRMLAEVFGRKLPFVACPFSNIKFFAFLASLLTPVPAPITLSLMAGLKNEVLCEDDRIRRLIPFQPMTYREAIVSAMSREEQDSVYTRWSDAYPPAHELAMKLHEVDPKPKYTSAYVIVTEKRAADLFKAFCCVGGKKGWFNGNWMWRLRGLIDRLFSGVGTSRGRRSARELRVNDVIDFWRVEEIVPNETLLLRAEMILPGRAWLEFHIRELGSKQRLGVTAYFQSKGIWGRLYWYMFLPFHFYLFNDLLAQIEKSCDESN